MDSWEVSEPSDEPKVVDESIFFNEISFVESEVFANDSNEKHVTISQRNYALDSNIASLAIAAATHRNFGFQNKPSLASPSFEAFGRSIRTSEVPSKVDTVKDIETNTLEKTFTINQSDKTDNKRFQETHIECPTFTTHCSYDPAMLKHILFVILMLIYNGFLIGALMYTIEKAETPVDWHNGIGFLIIITAFVYGIILYKFLSKKISLRYQKSFFQERLKSLESKSDLRWMKYLCLIIVIGSIVVLLIVDVTIFSKSNNGIERQKFISILGIGFVIVTGAMISKKPSKINWQTVASHCLLTFVFCFCMIRLSVFAAFVQTIFEKVHHFVSLSRAGSKYLFGSLVDGRTTNANQSVEYFSPSSDYNDMYLAYLPRYFFHTLVTIYFTNFLFTILRISKIVSWMIDQLDCLGKFVVGISGIESVYALGRIFFEQSSVPILIKDNIGKLSESEFNTILTMSLSGTASLATLFDLPNLELDHHFVTASVLSITSAIVVSKLLWPETSKLCKDNPCSSFAKLNSDENKLDCIMKSFKISTDIIFTSSGLAIALLATISCLDEILHWAGTLYGLDSLNLAFIGEHILPPVLWSIGINWTETDVVARLFTYKVTRTDMTAMSFLNSTMMNDRCKVLSVYLLFNSVHPLGLALSVGTFYTLLSEDVWLLRKCLQRSLLGSLMANFLATAIVNTFLDE